MANDEVETVAMHVPGFDKQKNHRRMRRRSWMALLAVCVVVLCMVTRSYAGVTVYPTEVFVKPPNKSAPVVITNPGNTEIEVWLSFSYQYPVFFDSSGIKMSTGDSTSGEEPMASKWLRAIPQRFTLKPQESQVVRILAAPPPGLKSGEYWAQVVISSKERKPATTTEQAGAKFNMDIITQSAVPFHFRTGATTTGVQVREAQAFGTSKGVHVHLVLDRSGNASYWGRMTTRVLNSNGKVIKTKESRMVVYQSMDYSLDIDLEEERSGQYSVELVFDNRHPGLSPEFRIPSVVATQRIPVQ